MPGYTVIVADGDIKSGLECLECKLVLKDAVQTTEGVRLCESCFNKIAEEPNYISQKTGISVAGEDGKPSCFPDRAVRRTVQQLQVVCKYKNFGCKWVGKLGTYFQDHEEHCQVPCEHCGVTVVCNNLQKHQNTCKKFLLSCKLCGCEVSRVKMGDHVKTECGYIQCACDKVLKRHVQDDDPESLASHLKDPVVLLSHMIAIMALGNHIMQQIKACEDRVSASEETIRSVRSEVDSRIRANSSQIKDLKECSIRQRKIVSANTTQIKDLKERSTRQEEQSIRQGEIIESPNMRSQSAVRHPSNYGPQQTYDLLTRLETRVSELHDKLRQMHDCKYIWKILDVERHKQDSIDGRVISLYSPPFYTAQHGYKLCIKAFLDGDGMGHKTHLSLYFVLMKGEFDALLKWPFENKVSLILVDQSHRKHLVQTFKPTPESSSFQRPISDMNVASGYPQFCELSYLNDDNYTKDDVMFIKCIVDASDVFYP